MVLSKSKSELTNDQTKSSEAKPKLASITPVSQVIKSIPTTRYYGSKRKLLPWIFENVKSLKFSTVLDGFGGTASVSLLFKAMGKDVTYHDAFAFNRHVATTVLGDRPAVNKKDFTEFVHETMPRRAFIYNNFEGVFYTDEENAWLDGISWKLYSSKLKKNELSLYRYALLQACLKKRPFNLFHRANLNIRLNDQVTRSFGNKTTWEKPFDQLMFECYEELEQSFFQSKSKIRISGASDISNVASGHDLVYLDPPYISLSEKNNRDDYWKKYHFLEGLCRYPEWPKNINPSSQIRAMHSPKYFDEWSRKATFKQRLFRLIEKHQKSIVVLSYVSNAFPDESEIVTHFERLFPIVSVHSKDHPHALSKSRKRELLFIGRHG